MKTVQKTCKQCAQGFVVEDADLEFYKKMSPIFNGDLFDIPVPTLCPDCRRQRRLAWRNMKVVYSRKCDYSGESIVSPFAPNSKFKVYKGDIWWSDKWNAFDFGQDYDFSKPFFGQIKELQAKVPNMHLFSANNENSDFCNCTSSAKDSYMVQNGTEIEKCYFSQSISKSKDIIDCLRTYKSERCYECVLADNCYDCYYLKDSDYCTESYFLDSCNSCKNCFACANIRHKQYWVYNKQVTKEEFERVRDEFLSLRNKKRYEKIIEIRRYLEEFPKKYIHELSNEDITGDYIYHSKNVKNCFLIGYCENLKHCHNMEYSKDCYDVDFWGFKTEKILDSAEIGDGAYNILFSEHCWESRDLMYCIGMVNNSRDCFGCVNLRGAQYCILNKQYSREQYEQLVPRIIEHMRENGEWGEFFPMDMSYFGYNESSANDYYNLTREEATKVGTNWQDQDFGIKYDGNFYEPEDINEYKSNQKKVEQALSGILKCEITGKPFKLQPGELAFYIQNNIQIPLFHPDQRYTERFKLTNQLKLWKRRCDCERTDHTHSGKCQSEFETTYDPDQPEKVYCEKCYQKEII